MLRQGTRSDRFSTHTGSAPLWSGYNTLQYMTKILFWLVAGAVTHQFTIKADGAGKEVVHGNHLKTLSELKKPKQKKIKTCPTQISFRLTIITNTMSGARRQESTSWTFYSLSKNVERLIIFK